MRRSTVLITLLAVTALGLAPTAGAQSQALPSVPVDVNQMEHVANVPNVSGNALDFFERRLDDGTVKWYAVAATQGNGFDILDITDPTTPTTVGRYLLPPEDRVTEGPTGFNWHSWVSVNPRRNIVALTVENPFAVTTRHNGGAGIQFVDITDVTNPVALGRVDGIDGPHTVRMMGDNHAYTSLNTWVVDYTDPMNPTAERRGQVEGHEFWEDANHPGRGYVGMATTTGRWGVMDLTDYAKPTTPIQVPDNRIVAAHEVYPSPDSAFVGVADFKAGQSTVDCPGGGIHFYDITGGYVPDASLAAPAKMGVWFAPFTGLSSDPASGSPNYASCTMHSWQMHPERMLALGGLYAGGTWVFDPSGPTRSDGEYEEFDGGARGTTTWGTTLANVRDAADYVNATQWLPFDLDSPEAIEGSYERLVFVNGWTRGLDVYRYTGPLPRKLSRLTVDGTAGGGTVTGTLERYAVLTDEGWRNHPLAGRTLEVTAGGETVEVVTDGDGTFSASLGLEPGTHTITVTWGGDDRYEETGVSRQVTSS